MKIEKIDNFITFVNVLTSSKGFTNDGIHTHIDNEDDLRNFLNKHFFKSFYEDLNHSIHFNFGNGEEVYYNTSQYEIEEVVNDVVENYFYEYEVECDDEELIDFF